MARKKLTDAELLRLEADALLHEQQRVLAHAGNVVRQAGRELSRATTEEYIPRFMDSSRSAAQATRGKIVNEVLPSVASVIGTTMAAIDSARHKGLDRAEGSLSSLSALSKKAGKMAPALVTKPKPGLGKYIAIGIGVAAVVGIGYVLFQTFRADDELWVDEDEY